MQQNSASRAQRRAKERAAIHARLENMKPSIQGKLPRRRRSQRQFQATRNLKPLKPLWDDSVAGKVLPPSRRELLAAPTTMKIKKSTSNNRPNSRIRTIDLIDRCDGSPTSTRQVRSIICKRPSVEGKSQCLISTKNAATSPVDTSCALNGTGVGEPLLTRSVAKLQDREAEALDKLEKHLIELETLEDMIRMHIADDDMSILGPEYCSSDDTCDSGSLAEDTTDADDGSTSRSVPSFDKPTSKAASAEIPAPLNISLEEAAEAKLIRSSRANQCRRRQIIEEPFEKAGLPAHIVLERAVESIIDDEIQLLAHELDLSPLAT